MIELHLIFIAIALVGYVYSVILTEPGMVFSWLYLFLENRLPDYLFKPLIGCYKCVAGQMGLWLYLKYCDQYDPFHHAYFISITIFFSLIINKIYHSWVNS